MTRQRRVAVTSPQTRLALARRRTGAPAVPPHLAPADVERARRLHRRQLRYALGALALLAALLLGLPLLLAAVPELDTVRLAGVPVSWLAVAVLPYPLLALLAGWQLRRAERAERPARHRSPGRNVDRTRG
jgi:sterol desaturase/sphingolipid hydroxylase (fatty acid hydroxylase superfamily)